MAYWWSPPFADVEAGMQNRVNSSDYIGEVALHRYMKPSVAAAIRQAVKYCEVYTKRFTRSDDRSIQAVPAGQCLIKGR